MCKFNITFLSRSTERLFLFKKSLNTKLYTLNYFFVFLQKIEDNEKVRHLPR